MSGSMVERDDGIELGRRAHERFAVQVDAEVSTAQGTVGAVTRDVSRGGVCFTVLGPMLVGTRFDIALSLVLGENRFSEPLRLQGVVIWCTRTAEGYQIGAGWTALAPDTREFLQMFLNFLGQGLPLDETEAGEPDGEEDDGPRGTKKKGLFG
jgi:hypothetical protein